MAGRWNRDRPAAQRPIIGRPAPTVRRIFELAGPDAGCELDGEPGVG
jgi:hypothetical protein